MCVRSNGQLETFRVIHVLEFTSERRRMGILLQDEADNTILLMKGSDDAIFRRSGNSKDKDFEYQEQVEAFSRTGLRTLVAAYRIVCYFWSLLVKFITRLRRKN